MSIAPPPQAPPDPAAPPPDSLLTPPPAADWRTTLPDDLKADKSLEGFKDVAGLAKSYVETKKLVGQKTLKVPAADSSPDDIAAWRKALNIPETADGYLTIVKLPEIAADPAWNKDAEKSFLSEMHKLHAPPAVVQAALNIYGSLEAQKRDGAVKETQAASQELRREWGATFDANLGRANRAIQEFGGGELIDVFESSGLGRNPIVVKTFAKIGNALVESGAMATEGLASGLTPDEARQKIADLRKEMAKLPEGSPRTKELIDEVLALTRVIHRG